MKHYFTVVVGSYLLRFLKFNSKSETNIGVACVLELILNSDKYGQKHTLWVY